MKQYKIFKPTSFLLLLIISIVLMGCSNDENEDTENNNNNNNGETALNVELIDEGKKVVETSCIGCHGSDLTGDMGPSLHNLSLTKEEIIEVLTRGKGSMPPATAKDHEEAVAEYLLSLK